MSLPHKLSNLTTREAITDAIHRATAAFDENDPNLLASSMTQDVVFELRGHTLTGLDTLKTQSLAIVGPMVTTHHVTNVRIEVTGEQATEAKATAKAIAYHYPRDTALGSGATGWNVGVNYIVDLVKENDGLWKAKKWVIETMWGEGDYEVMKA